MEYVLLLGTDPSFYGYAKMFWQDLDNFPLDSPYEVSVFSSHSLSP